MSNSQEEHLVDQQVASSDKKITFEERFQNERVTWTGVVQEIAKRFRTVENLAEVQVDLYSRRQEAIEYLFKLIGIHNKLKKAFATEYKAALEKASFNEDIRYNDKERAKFAEATTAETKFKIDSTNSQMEFFRETTKTIDNMIFGVKHRIDIENFKIGIK